MADSEFDFDLEDLKMAYNSEETELRARAQLLKKINLAKIFSIVCKLEPCSRAELNETHKRIFNLAYKLNNLNRHLANLVSIGVIGYESYHNALTNDSEIHHEIIRKHKAYYGEKVVNPKWNINLANYYFATEIGKKIIPIIYKKLKGEDLHA